MMVPSGQSGEKLWNTWFRRGLIAQEEATLRKKADEVLDFLTISHIADEKAGNISGGQKKLVELGRTMMVDAKVVFLDEVGAGVKELAEKIEKPVAQVHVWFSTTGKKLGQFQKLESGNWRILSGTNHQG
jgi:ABC-type branched-subunit amino acid transport system ATPase component